MDREQRVGSTWDVCTSTHCNRHAYTQVRLLLARGARADVKNKKDKTALELASQDQIKAMLREVMSHPHTMTTQALLEIL